MRSLCVVVALLAACYRPDFDKGLFCSDPEMYCPPSETCVAGRCRRISDLMDAPTLDGPSNDGQAACTLYPPGGCLPGFKCTVDQTMPSTPPFCTSAGSVGAGSACTGTGASDTCATGLFCLSGTCRAFCGSPDTPTCGGTDVCVSLAPPPLPLCLERCNVLSPVCATTGGAAQNCYFLTNSAGACVVPTNNLAIGQTCQVTQDCVSGAGCVNSVCARYCDYVMFPNQQGPCNAGQTCIQLHGSSVGACQ